LYGFIVAPLGSDRFTGEDVSAASVVLMTSPWWTNDPPRLQANEFLRG